jgi:hypothetical protein
MLMLKARIKSTIDLLFVVLVLFVFITVMYAAFIFLGDYF